MHAVLLLLLLSLLLFLLLLSSSPHRGSALTSSRALGSTVRLLRSNGETSMGLDDQAIQRRNPNNKHLYIPTCFLTPLFEAVVGCGRDLVCSSGVFVIQSVASLTQAFEYGRGSGVQIFRDGKRVSQWGEVQV